MARQSRTAAARRSAAARRTDTDDPSRSRERALRVLFQADVRGVAPSVTLARLDDDPAARALLDERDVLTEGEPVLPPPTSDERATSSPAGGAGRGRGLGAGAGSGSGAGTTAGVAGRSGAGSSASAGASAKGGTGASGWSDAPSVTETAPLDGFTRSLVQGVEEHRVEVEGLITRYARRWAISRMPVVDRNVLRLATYELLHEPTPHAVVLDEAIGLAKRMSTDDSGRFVNGVLESIRQQLAAEAAEAPEAAEAADATDDDAVPATAGATGHDAGTDAGNTMDADEATGAGDAADGDHATDAGGHS